ncbi:MAG: NADP-specific glutamate dehydrogenase [Gemmatimonadota bacterium]|nr:NADP-specific glutamate dehydrogenase [Gemmatimonadota bacterium]
MDVEGFMDVVVRRNPNEPEFHQAVHEVVDKIAPVIDERPEYADARLLQRMVEPDRAITFRISWEDDDGVVHVNRGYRVQFNNALGPYKGGLRFDASVNYSILKFLGFEQVLKNALTTLPMGGAKGGADFDPKGKSDREVMRFCQALMTELHRHIGKDVDIPAGDIGVGTREIGFLFGQYKRTENEWAGVLTGKGIAFGGSLIRTEATGYGCVYFAREMMNHRGEDLEGKPCTVSGSGNVAQYAAEKLMDLGAKVLTLSDRGGTILAEDGLTHEQLDRVIRLKTEERGALEDVADELGVKYAAGETPWSVECELAFPCATQNEIDADDAKTLVENGCRGVVEGANMPATYDASKVFEEARVLHAPGKAANAGGVAISGLEMTQNAMRMRWEREEVDERLQRIMRRIHEQCLSHGSTEDGRVDYVRGANVAGFLKVADAMLAYGVM